MHTIKPCNIEITEKMIMVCIIITNENKNYFKNINKNKWKKRIKKYDYIQDIYPRKIYKHEINDLTVLSFRNIMKIRSCHLTDLKGHNKYIKNDKKCNLCNMNEIQDLEHVYLTCNEKIEYLHDEIEKFLSNQGKELNMINILYPFEQEILNMNNKQEIQHLMDKRIHIIIQ